MTNVMSYGSESKLRLPSCYVEVTDNEMEYTDGGAWWHWLAAAVVGAAVAIGISVATAGSGTGIGVKAGLTVGQIVLVGLLGGAGGALSYGIGIL